MRRAAMGKSKSLIFRVPALKQNAVGIFSLWSSELFEHAFIFGISRFHSEPCLNKTPPMRSMNDWLGSDETGEAFSHCISCKFPLVEIDEPWLVNKEFMADECVMEYAICQPCRERIMNPMSESSKQAVRNFLEEAIDWEARVKEFMLAHDATSRFDQCIACRESRTRLINYGISALFDSGGILVEGALPLMMCQCCVDKITATLSPESRAIWQRFLASHFDSPSSGFGGVL